MAKKATQMARSIPAPVGASALANLEATTTTQAAQAHAAPGLKTGTSTNFSGQYLYDRFVANDKTEVTKLGIVRQMVEQIDVARFKEVLAEFVKVAVGYRDNAIKAAKDAGTYDKDAPGADIEKLSARVKTAANHQTVMRVAYGAMKFAPDHLAKHGFDTDTGYQVMAVIARKALADAQLKWDGSKLLDKTQSEKREQSKLETKALEAIMNESPRNDGESMGAYLARCSGQLEAKVNAVRAEQEQKQIDALVKKVREQCGGLLDDVLERIMSNAAMGENAIVDEHGAVITPGLEPKAAKEAAQTATHH